MHCKPILLLNSQGHWDGLVGLLDGIIDAGFADDSLRGHFSVLNSVGEVIAELRTSLPLARRSAE